MLNEYTISTDIFVILLSSIGQTDIPPFWSERLRNILIVIATSNTTTALNPHPLWKSICV